MSEVAITTVAPLSIEVQEAIEAKLGFEMQLDDIFPDDDDNGNEVQKYRYFIGHDSSNFPDDDIFSPDDCQQACEWIEATFPFLKDCVAMDPYQWGYKY